MNFYDVVLASRQTNLDDALTYHTELSLKIGQLVRVPLGKKLVSGVVFGRSQKPEFKTKQVADIYELVLPPHLLKLVRHLSSFYACPLSNSIGLLLPTGINVKRRKFNNNQLNHLTEKMQDLTADQASAIKQIVNAPNNQTITLHGDTGTGKTRVYIEIAKTFISSSKGVIILVPEIGLTAQLVNEFSTVFKDVFVQHSRQSQAERHLQWLKILDHPAPVVVGPRSALFAPIKQLGAVIIDESHDASYKQDQTPKYSALRVARMLCNLADAKLILGSATPSAQDMYFAKQSQAPVIRMSQLAAIKQPVSTTQVVDMRLPDNRGKLISPKTSKAIEATLSKNLQVMVFHNRRGTSTSVVCELCGHQLTCKNCSTFLTHHHDSQNLKCHLCGYSEKLAIICPSCKKAGLKYQGFGTKRIEQELIKLFPGAKVARFDSDVAIKKSLALRHGELVDGKVDIIVGTQMIAKGLDLPRLGTVVVPLSDSLLGLPDFSASERFFQLIYQVSGRAGRHRPGKIIIQTYNPELKLLGTALRRDYQEFYDLELAQRQENNYPPFVFLLSLTCVRKTESSARNNAQKLVEVLKQDYPSLSILGPAPAFYQKTSRGYHWQIVAKSKNRQQLLEISQNLPSGWQFDIDPLNLL